MDYGAPNAFSPVCFFANDDAHLAFVVVPLDGFNGAVPNECVLCPDAKQPVSAGGEVPVVPFLHLLKGSVALEKLNR